MGSSKSSSKIWFRNDWNNWYDEELMSFFLHKPISAQKISSHTVECVIKPFDGDLSVCDGCNGGLTFVTDGKIAGTSMDDRDYSDELISIVEATMVITVYRELIHYVFDTCSEDDILQTVEEGILKYGICIYTKSGELTKEDYKKINPLLRQLSTRIKFLKIA